MWDGDWMYWTYNYSVSCKVLVLIQATNAFNYLLFGTASWKSKAIWCLRLFFLKIPRMGQNIISPRFRTPELRVFPIEYCQISFLRLLWGGIPWQPSILLLKLGGSAFFIPRNQTAPEVQCLWSMVGFCGPPPLGYGWLHWKFLLANPP